MAAATGNLHSAAVGEDGALLVWGNGEHGKLGTGDTVTRLAPTRVAGLPAPVRQVAAGQCHTGIVTDAGDLLMCGAGQFGFLGLGDENDRPTLTPVARALFDGDAALMVACGCVHTAVVTEDGGVYTFGCGKGGRLGHGCEENELAPRRVPAAGFNGERVVMVAAGEVHTVALSEQGRAYTWGFGNSGQLGHNRVERERAPRQVDHRLLGGEKAVFVAAGGLHTVAVTAGGQLYSWGHGGHGRLGHGDLGNRLVPTQVGAGVFGGSAVVMAACGYYHTLVVTHDGALWACGLGRSGRLGLNDTSSRHVFARVGAGTFGGARVVAAAAGFAHSAAVTEDGALWTWGIDDDWQLGHGRNRGCRLVPTLVPGTGLGGARIGRCRGLPAEHVLAFAMGTHGRLGAGAHAHCSALAGEPGLVAMIAGLCCGRLRWPARGERGCAGEGVVRLLGGGLD